MLHLDHLSGGKLMQLRQAAFNHHRAKLEELRSAPDYAALREHCLAHPPRPE
jgi:hypothetical protein